METTHCPECGSPAELVDRAVMESTDGPVEHAHVRCVLRHRFWLPVEYLTREPQMPARECTTPRPVPVRRRRP